MGREVRMVPKEWEHPKDKQTGRYRPLYGSSYAAAAKEFLEMATTKGLQEAVDWMGCPDKEDYMPDWKPEERTHLMMYEDTSEGTPISPAFETPEEMAQWLSENGASAFGDMTASYDDWLHTCKRGYAVGMVIDKNGMRPGVSL